VSVLTENDIVITSYDTLRIDAKVSNIDAIWPNKKL
jgi:hypothetical protein